MKNKSTLQLFIHSPSDQVITLNNLHPDTSIQDLKSALELKSGIIAEYQNLLINNTKLENGKTLAECKVKSGSFVRLRLKENSLEQIYVSAINGKIEDIFMLGVQKIESDGDTNDEFDDEEEQIKAWNAFVPYRAFQGLFAACFGGQLNLMTQLLMKSAAHIKMGTKSGRTLLHAAASQGHLLCVDFLLAQGVDTKQADKYGMTALMIAAEYGFVKVEKRIWLYSWNMSVLDDFIQSDEKIVLQEKNRTEQSNLHDEGEQKEKQLQEDRKAERQRSEDRDRILEPSKGLDDAPKPFEQKFEKQGTYKEKEDREGIRLPSITKTDDDKIGRQGKQKPRPLKLPTVRDKIEKSENKTFHKSSNPELNVSAINNSNRIKEIKENVAKSKIILQTEERNIRVSAWIHDNTHDVSGKCPLRPLSPNPQPSLTGPVQIPYMPGAFKPTKPLLPRKQKDYEKISAEPNVPVEKSKFPSQAKSVQSEGNDIKTGTSVTNIDLGEEFDLMATFLRKGLVRTERNTVEKYNQEMKKKESNTQKKRTIEGRFIDTIQQISDETMSFSRSLLMLSPGCLNEDDEKPPIKSTSIRIPTAQDTSPANDMTEQAFSVPRKNIIRCENNALNDSQSETYEHMWRPIESQLDPTDSSSFYARFGKTYEEWLKEKRKLKRSQTKKDDESEPMTDNETEVDKIEKNEEAFSRWLYTKERERLKMKIESRTTKTDPTDEKPLQTGITFEEWKKIKKNIQQAQNEILSRKRPPQRIKRGMTFDQWKTWKSEQRKAIKDKQENARGEIDDRKLGLSFEKWVRKKDELKKLEDSIIALTKEKEEKRKAFLLQFRLNDPRQRTFEEWYLEKKHQFMKQKKKREESKEKKKERYPEDSELIFNMWLLNKYQMEMCNEKGKYRNSKRRNKLEQMEAIEETDADYASSFESDLSD